LLWALGESGRASKRKLLEDARFARIEKVEGEAGGELVLLPKSWEREGEKGIRGAPVAR